MGLLTEAHCPDPIEECDWMVDEADRFVNELRYAPEKPELWSPTAPSGTIVRLRP